MRASTRVFDVLLVVLLILLGIGFAASWQTTGAATASGTSTGISISARPAPSSSLISSTTHAGILPTLTFLAEGLSLMGCIVLYSVSIRLRKDELRQVQAMQSAELALERRVEERTRELRREIEDRHYAEHLNHGHKRILEMLLDPAQLNAEEILGYLAKMTAARNRGWECALHLAEDGGKTLRLVAHSEVNRELGAYLGWVGSNFKDTPECQACASGETHIVEHLSGLGLPWSELLVANGVFSVWSIPFFVNGSCTLAGTLTVYGRSRTKPTAAELDMSESWARLAALVLDHRHLHTELTQSVYRDAVTDLPNRRAGEQALEAAMKKAESQDESVAVVWVDVNRFKRINDQYGHEIGDHVLRTVAERLRRSPLCTDSDTVARMGEDEFLVLIAGTNDSLDAVEIPRRLGAAIAKPIYAGSAKISVSASIGVCVFPRDGATIEVLERNSDFALSRAKSSGQGYCVFSPAMSQEASEKLEIEEALGTALDRNYLRLVYQPLYSRRGELTGFEALLRFQHPQLGNVSPARFIPIAEETRLIIPIGNWVLREACRQLQAWRQAGLPRVNMSVNISALQFARDDFADMVARTFSAFGLAAEDLMLELTESVVMQDYDVVVRQMNLLRQCGVQIAMDDFGTGYSSLGTIHRIPVDLLKIDRSFIERVADPEGTRPIVETVIAMARHLGLQVVAEGVETVEQRNILEQAGCDGFQGYLFARPLAPEDAEQCLRDAIPAPVAAGAQHRPTGLAVA